MPAPILYLWTCRSLRDKAASTEQQNIAVLTPDQKTKLKILSDAMKLIPTISEAQSGALLGSTASPPFLCTSNSAGVSFVATWLGFSPVPGCAAVSVSAGILGGILGPAGAVKSGS